MNNHTHLLHTHARKVIATVAQQITDIKPWQAVNRSIRTQTLLISCDLYGYSPYADTVSTTATQMMPVPRAGETRGEYALRLRAVAGTVNH
jgi:hypothetical protein